MMEFLKILNSFYFFLHIKIAERNVTSTAPTTRGRFHQHLRANFSHAQDSTPFWRMAFGEWHLANGVHSMANFDLILALLLC